MFVILIGTFLVNSFPALALFNLGASRSFVSHSFNKDFVMALGVLECLLRVSIANEQGFFFECFS